MHYLLLAVLLTCFAVGSFGRTYTFGINLPNDEEAAGPTYYPPQPDTLKGLEIWRDWWNSLPASKRTTRWGDTIEVALHVSRWSNYSLGFVAEAETKLCEIYGNMSIDPTIDYMFVPIALMGVNIRRCSYEQHGVEIMLSSGDSSQQYYNIPGSFGSRTAHAYTLSSWLPYLRIARAKTIALLRVPDYVYQAELCQGLADQAPDQGLTIARYYESMPFDWYTVGEIDGIDDRAIIWERALDDIIKLNPDAVAICDYGYGVDFALRYWKTKNWLPKSLAVTTIPGKMVDRSMLDFVVSPAQYSSSARFVAQEDFVNSEGYDKLVMERYGIRASQHMAAATLAGMIYTNSLIRAASNSSADLVAAIKSIQLRSFMGLMTIDGNTNANTMSALVTQLLDGGKQVNLIGPAIASAEEFIYPMPSWNERVFEPKWGDYSEIVAVVLMVLGTLITIVCGIFLFWYRDRRTIVAASPLFCSLILVGNQLVVVSMVTWMPSLVSSPMCMARPWILSLGFVLMFAALIVKTHRVYRLFDTGSLRIIVISNRDVGIWVGVIVLAQIIINIFMICINAIESRLTVKDPYRLQKNFYSCTFPVVTKIMFGINMAMIFGLLCWGSWLAWAVRKIPLKMFDESKVIAFSIYNIFFFAGIGIIFRFAIGDSNRHVTFLLHAIFCFLGSNLTTCSLFGSKAHAIRSGFAKTSKSNTSSSGGSALHSHSESSMPANRRSHHPATSTNNSSNASPPHDRQKSVTNSPRAKSASPLASSKSVEMDDSDPLEAKIAKAQERLDELIRRRVTVKQ